MEQELINAVSSGGLEAVLGTLVAFLIMWLRSEISDHKETLKEIAMVRQKQEEVAQVVEASRTKGGGI